MQALEPDRSRARLRLAWSEVSIAAAGPAGVRAGRPCTHAQADGRWIAAALELPGCLAIEVIADHIAHGELPSSAVAVSRTLPDGQLARQ